jgi:cytochrome c556
MFAVIHFPKGVSMKSPFYRLMTGFCTGSLVVALALVACGGGEEEAAETPQTAQPADANLSVRQARMKEISQICGGINKVLKAGSVENVAADAQKLREIMTEVATIPPPYDTEKYKFYAQDFQAKADTLAMNANTGSVDTTKPAFITLTETCGVCHYTCKYPIDL